MGENVNTDVLHPSSFFSLDDQRVRAGFLQAAAGYEQVGTTDLSDRIVLAGSNFGCGSSRETGARVFLLARVRAVVARSMARIFSRNLRNLGIIALECPSLPAELENGCPVTIDLTRWTLTLPSTASPLSISRLDPFWECVLNSGGLMQFLGFSDD